MKKINLGGQLLEKRDAISGSKMGKKQRDKTSLVIAGFTRGVENE